MRQIRPFADTRLGGCCVYCGDFPDTRDHIPPRVFLDDPLPSNLAVVPCCRECNLASSADEEYLACLLEVASCGTTDVDRLERRSIARTLAARPLLRARLAAAFNRAESSVEVEHARVRRVIEKLARGIWSYETATNADPTILTAEYVPLAACDDDTLETFTTLAPLELLPEVGSRLMIRVIEDWSMENQWQIVQPTRFAYAVEAGSSPPRVKMVFRDYLACEVCVAV